MRKRVEMPDVIALDLEPRAILRAGRQDLFYGGEGGLENAVARVFEIRPLPFVFERLKALQHRIETEIHRARVERSDLGLELGDRPQPLVDGHCGGAAGSDVNHTIRALLDDAEEGRKAIWRLIGPPVARLARVKMHDRRARPRRA